MTNHRSPHPTHHRHHSHGHPHHSRYVAHDADWAHSIKMPFNEHSCDVAHYPGSKSNTSWAALDHHGVLITKQSHEPDTRKDPASTTKLWTFYTVATLIHEGKLPKNFLEKHHREIDRMLIRSDNVAAMYIAQEACGSVKNFCSKMNALADRHDMHGTHFNVPNGMPNMGNYSTAHEMARMAYLLDRDFPELTHWVGQRHVPSVGTNTGIVALTHGWDWGKTGTGGGCHQPKGTISYTGKTEDGHYAALSGAKGKNKFHEMVIKIAHSLSDLEDKVLHGNNRKLQVADVEDDRHASVHTPSHSPSHKPAHRRHRE